VRDLVHDLRYALRMLRKRPAFALIAAAALALGIGANSAVFSVVNGLLLRPLALPDLERLVTIRGLDPHRPLAILGVAPADYLDWKRRTLPFEGLSAYLLHDFDFTGEGGEPEGIRGAQVTADLFRTLHTRPLLGRDFRDGEDQPGRDQVAILSDALWRNRFAADRGIIGRTILLDGRRVEVVGVMAPGFEFPYSSTTLWTPLALDPSQRADRRTQSLLTAARLRDGISLPQATGAMDLEARRLAGEYPSTNDQRGARLVLLREQQGEFSKPFLTLMQVTALFVLLIACTNVANLQLAQGIARKREISIRAALGARRWRVVRMLLVESIALALAGGAIGVAVAYGGVALIRWSVPAEGTRFVQGWNQVAVHPPVLVFTLLIAVVAGILFGLSSAWQASRLDLAASLKDGAQQGGARSRLRPALVVGEVLLAVVAVTGSSQMVRGFQAMFDTYRGFSPDRILAIRLVLPSERYDTPHKVRAFYDRALDEAANVPGVRVATLTSNLPGALHFNPSGEMVIEGRPALSAAQKKVAELQFAGPGYFEGLNIPILSGRAITRQDAEDTPLVAVISARLAARDWPGENPIGRHVRYDAAGPGGWRTIVGVAGDIHQFWFQKESRPLIYVPYRQSPPPSMYLAMRTAGDPLSVLPTIREQLHRLDPALPLQEPRSMLGVMQETMAAMRLTTGIMSVFGLVSFLLAGVGVYGVMAWSVQHRKREFGIRMALGARPRAVLRMVLRQGAVLAAWGILLGIGAGYAVSRAMSGIMFGVTAASLAVLAGVPLLLLVCSLVACWQPARSATQADPIQALREP
jgi:putative ABC transport system permease protein